AVVDWPAPLAQRNDAGAKPIPNLSSLQIVQYDPDSGKPNPYGNYAHARGPFDRPFRWYDSSIPYQFPEFLGYASEHDGQFPRQVRIRAGYFYDALGDWKEGHLAWVHTQKKSEVSHYAV